MTLTQIMIVLLLTIIYMAIGTLWYSRWLFGNIWVKLSNFDSTQVTNSNMKLAFGLGILQKFLKSLLIFYFVINVSFLLPGTYFLLCIILIGMICLESINDYIWGSKSWILALINCLHIISATLINIMIATYLLG